MKGFLKWISTISRFTKMQLDKEFKDLGFNSSQHIYILKICEDPGIAQEDLLTAFNVNASNVTRALAHLEKRKLYCSGAEQGQQTLLQHLSDPKSKRRLPGHQRRPEALELKDS